MSPVETILRECGLEAGVGFWRFDARRGLLHWPRGFGPARDESYGAWYQLGEFGQSFEPAQRARFFDYFDHLVEPGTVLTPLELPIRTGAGPMLLRIEGKPLGGDLLLAAGLVRNVTRRHEAEDRARALTQILDGILVSSTSGIVVLDGHDKVLKANRAALRMFGVAAPDDSDARGRQALDARLPAALRVELAACHAARATAAGELAPDETGGKGLQWRAQPWGRTGVILFLDGPVPAEPMPAQASAAPSVARAPAPPTAAIEIDRGRAMLDCVHHPCVIIQTRDASIDFANRAARDKLGLKSAARTYINNLFELSGRHAPNHHYVLADRVGPVLTLPMGARVSRMTGLDPDLLFVEYL